MGVLLMSSCFVSMAMALSMVSKSVQSSKHNQTLQLSSKVSTKPSLTSVVLRNTSTSSEETTTTILKKAEFVNSVLGTNRYTFRKERKEQENRNKTILFSIAGIFAGILLLSLIKCLILPWCRRNCFGYMDMADIYIRFTSSRDGQIYSVNLCEIKVGECYCFGDGPPFDMDVKYGENELRPTFTCYDFPFSCMPHLKIKYNDNEVFSKSRGTRIGLNPIIKLSFMQLLEMRSILNSPSYKYIFYARRGDAKEFYRRRKWPNSQVEVQTIKTTRYTALRRSVMVTEQTQTEALNNSRDYDSSDTSSDDDAATFAGTDGYVRRNGSSKHASTAGTSVLVTSNQRSKTNQNGANCYIMQCNRPGANLYMPNNRCNNGTSNNYRNKGTSSNYCNKGTPSNYSNKGTPSNYCNKGTPSNYSNKDTPSNYSNKGTPSNYCNKGTPSNYSNKGTPSNYCNKGTPSNYSNKGTPSNYSNKGTPSNYCNKGTPSNNCNKGTPSNYSNKGTPSNNCNKGTPSNYSNKGTPSNYCNKGTSSNYCNKGTPSNYSNKGTPSNNCNKGTPSNYCNKGTPSNNCNKGTPSNYCNKGTPSNYCNKGTPSNNCNKGTRTSSSVRNETETEKASDFVVELSSDSD